jgi:uridine kinase
VTDAEILIRYLQKLPKPTNSADAPIIVAIDGRSGTGKSTLTAAVAKPLGATVIKGDDFYAGGSDEHWDALDAAEKVAQVIDWPRQRVLLGTLRERRPAIWYPYDWEANDGRLSIQGIVSEPSDVVILEGAYAARPELADLLTVRVLLHTEVEARRDRLATREGEEYRRTWEARWTEAEDYYFNQVMPPDAFDLVLTSPDLSPPGQVSAPPSYTA